MSNFSATNFKDARVLVRVDFNVPLNEDFSIGDDNRMRAAVPTIKKILSDGGKAIIMSHLGRPKEGPTEKYSLKHLVGHLSELLGGVKVHFADDCIGEDAYRLAESMQPGEVLLLENLRFYKQEEKGDKEFAQKLAKLGDYYVNDAFGTAHRAHASTAVIADYFYKNKKMFGYLMEAEIESAEKVLHHADKPFTAILGGAKVSDKIMMIENLMNRANNIIIGGGMAYTFFKAMGGEIGNSLLEEDKMDVAKEVLEKAKKTGVNIYLPKDSIVADKFAADANTKEAENGKIENGWMGLDIGPKAIEEFSKVIAASKTILWNGPMGVFEMEKFSHGTIAIAKAVAEATKKGAYSLVGGGDSVAAVNQLGFADAISYVSTGGGAMLEFFEGKELPGIAAIRR
jgi:phosphoglycerate kinase